MSKLLGSVLDYLGAFAVILLIYFSVEGKVNKWILAAGYLVLAVRMFVYFKSRRANP